MKCQGRCEWCGSPDHRVGDPGRFCVTYLLEELKKARKELSREDGVSEGEKASEREYQKAVDDFAKIGKPANEIEDLSDIFGF